MIALGLERIGPASPWSRWNEPAPAEKDSVEPVRVAMAVCLAPVLASRIAVAGKIVPGSFAAASAWRVEPLPAPDCCPG